MIRDTPTSPEPAENLARRHYRQLRDGTPFTVDGSTWYIAAVPLFGNVAVYTSDRRDDDAPTTRIDVPEDGIVTVAPGDEYQSAIDALTARGLNARLHRESAGRYIVVELEGESAIHIGDLNDTGTGSSGPLTGWCAQLIDLTGYPAAGPLVYEAPDPDPTPMAEAVVVFLHPRYTWGWLANEAEAMLTQRFGHCAPDMIVSSDGPFVTVAWTGDGATRRLRVSSYPRPDRGVYTTGEPVTGWRVTAWNSHDFGDPGAEGDVIYDVAGDPDTERLTEAVVRGVQRRSPSR